MNFINSKAIEVSKIIEKDFSSITAEEICDFFSKSLTDSRAMSFIKYYNKTVLDKNDIDFGEFKHQWAIQGMRKHIYQEFNEYFGERKQEIVNEKDIRNFYNKYCRKERNEAAFCCKLFHTILPDEFPPLDNPIKNHFKLQRIDFMESLLIVKRAYELFINKNPDKIKIIREILDNPKFKIFRVREISNLRLLDMYYWLMISRKS